MPKATPTSRVRATTGLLQKQLIEGSRTRNRDGLRQLELNLRAETSIRELRLGDDFEGWLEGWAEIDIDETPANPKHPKRVLFNGQYGEYVRTNMDERSLKQSFIIQWLGEDEAVPCEHCKRHFKEVESRGRGSWRAANGLVYASCRTIEDLAGAVCGSCKRAHKESTCTVSKAWKEGIAEGIQREQEQAMATGTARMQRYHARTGCNRDQTEEEKLKEAREHELQAQEEGLD